MQSNGSFGAARPVFHLDRQTQTLANATGNHSCFVNVIIQCLYRVGALRSLLATAVPHPTASAADATVLKQARAAFSAISDAQPGASARGLLAYTLHLATKYWFKYAHYLSYMIALYVAVYTYKWN